MLAVSVECRLVPQGDARGWRAYLTDDDPGCPGCAEKEEVGDESLASGC